MYTYHHLKQLTGRMPSFSHVSYRPSLVGPASGLATLSRLPIAGSGYYHFPVPPRMAGLPRLTRFKAPLKGILVTRLAQPQLSIVNTHPMANMDGDWSDSNRFHLLQRGQLRALAQVVQSISAPSVVCGDFNVARDSMLHRDFMIDTGLADTFEGRCPPCPPTFHSHYLTPGKSARCIDFILVTASMKVEATATLFTDRRPLPAGLAYVSDHIGLSGHPGPVPLTS